MNIIVVDDEVASLGAFLYNVVNENELNYKMFQSNPQKCLNYVKNNPVSAAFLDINMPEINGVELAEKLVELEPKKIIFISGYSHNEVDIKAAKG